MLALLGATLIFQLRARIRSEVKPSVPETPTALASAPKAPPNDKLDLHHFQAALNVAHALIPSQAVMELKAAGNSESHARSSKSMLLFLGMLDWLLALFFQPCFFSR